MEGREVAEDNRFHSWYHLKRQQSRQVGSTICSMLYSKFTGNQATWWGLSQEKSSAEQYVQWKQQQGSAGISVNTECGLVVPMAYPWIVATPGEYNV